MVGHKGKAAKIGGATQVSKDSSKKLGSVPRGVQWRGLVQTYAKYEWTVAQPGPEAGHPGDVGGGIFARAARIVDRVLMDGEAQRPSCSDGQSVY